MAADNVTSISKEIFYDRCPQLQYKVANTCQCFSLIFIYISCGSLVSTGSVWWEICWRCSITATNCQLVGHIQWAFTVMSQLSVNLPAKYSRTWGLVTPRFGSGHVSSGAFWSLHLLGLIISEIFCHFASVMAIYLSVVYDETMTEGSIKPAKMRTQNILVFVMPLVENVTLLVIWEVNKHKIWLRAWWKGHEQRIF